MTVTFQKPITVGKTDSYTYTVNTQWLSGETIISHEVTVDAKVVKNNSSVNNNVIGVSLTGVSKGSVEMIFEYITSGGRSDCAKVILIVSSDCQ